MKQKLVLVKGGGDLATGIAYKLHRCGFSVVITEIAQPTAIRRTVAFGQAVYDGQTVVEGITAELAGVDQVLDLISRGKVPVVVDPAACCVEKLKPWAIVDAIIAKKNLGTAKSQAPIVIGIGPGFTAGRDVHAVIETMRGHNLGRVYLAGGAQPDTGVPGEIGGYTSERLLRAPVAGEFQAYSRIGEQVKAGQMLAKVEGTAIYAEINGILRGILQNGLQVKAGLKVGDIDPRCRLEHCFTISDKARSIGGGVLEALLWLGGNDC